MTPEEAGRRAEAMAMDLSTRQSSMATQLSHAGVGYEPNAAMAPPLHMATTYERPADGPYHIGDFHYTRMDNPTRLLLEHEMARLETHGGKHVDDNNEVVSCAFASGMMAVSSIILAHTAPVHVILPVDVYHGVPTVLVDVFSRFQVTVERVDLTDDSAATADQQQELENKIKKALERIPVKTDVIVWMETPSNPLCHVIDVNRIARLSKQIRNEEAGDVTVVVDSTLAPPTISQPLLYEHVDLVMHSGTKYLGGHSDVLLGIVTASPWSDRGREIGPKLRQVQIAVGGVPSAMDCWLTLRGLKTLAVRVQKQSDTALKLATYLHNHESVYKVHYPGLDNRGTEQYETAKRQLKNGCFGGVLSIETDSASKAMALAGALRTIRRATSLGGTETLIEHRASIEPPGRVTSPPGLLRIAVGLEDADDLIADLETALAIMDKLHAK